MKYFINSYSAALGQVVNYGTVYKTLTAAKIALRQEVAESRKRAKRNNGWPTHSHWNKEKTNCKITLAQDIQSTCWEWLGVDVCQPGIPYSEVK